ncbi:LOW QUALITY PROTEIN: hypothetical protein PanWU01x14_226910 [Parasponia andersonii]|uniref:Uncharacterized protein n=1 Tax=Parasponia andersonii TaxID=3476 RepID=A0A2P5BMA6_PARAD|nr:LOW QUALITY PROTEIN: hypothetical protein PanWU01x14_226910 [Parasponia andersonii]
MSSSYINRINFSRLLLISVILYEES